MGSQAISRRSGADAAAASLGGNVGDSEATICDHEGSFLILPLLMVLLGEPLSSKLWLLVIVALL